MFSHSLIIKLVQTIGEVQVVGVHLDHPGEEEEEGVDLDVQIIRVGLVSPLLVCFI